MSNRETLTSKAARWRAAMRSADTGPLVIAGEIVQIADDWERYREEASGLDATTWLRRTFGAGKGLPWFQMRAQAVTDIGEWVRRQWHHAVAVYVHRNVPKEKWEAAKFELAKAQKQKNGAKEPQPLTLAQAVPVLYAMLGKQAQRKVCGRCAALEKVLNEHGIAVPE